MANAGGLDFHQHFASSRAIKINSFYDQRRSRLVRNSSFDFHDSPGEFSGDSSVSHVTG